MSFAELPPGKVTLVDENGAVFNDANPLPMDVTLAGDVEIGAVEIKDATTDTRAKVLAASTAATATDTPVVVAIHPSSPLGAGTNAIGKLAANSGVDIGDVDILSIAAGDNNIGNVDVLSLTVGTSSNATSTAYENSRVIKASPGTLFQVNGYNSKTSSQFVQLFNSATVPADTAVPVAVITVPASSNFSIDYGVKGRAFDTGISISNSSTGPTKTIGSADIFIDAIYS